MSTTIERPQTIPDLSADEMERLRTVRDRQTPSVPTTPKTVAGALTVTGFRSWLESKESDAEVGMPRAANLCPIHGYLSETFRKRYNGFSVGLSCAYHPYGKPGDMRNDPLPQWARRFINRVDENPHYHPITARRALEVLGDVDEPRR